MKKKKIKLILGIIGLIFLGALGNALWDIIVPVGNWFLNIIFKITTLGLSSFDDAFYRSVAKGLHEESSLETLGLITIIIAVYIGGELGKIIIEYTEWHPTKKIKKMSSDEQDKYLKKLNLSSRRFAYIKAITLIIFTSFIIFRQATIFKRNHEVTRFRQVFTMTKFVMNEEEEELILTRFAAIQNKQDYWDVINTLIQKLEEKQPKRQKMSKNNK